MSRPIDVSPDGNIIWAKGKARGQHTPGVMNKTEAEHGLRLEALKRADEIAEYWFESVTFKLGKDLRYTPDFLVMLPDGTLECHECKGEHIQEDSTIKIRAAAEKFPFRFVLYHKRKTGAWEEKVFSK